MAILLCDLGSEFGGSDRAGPDSAGDDATPTATIARNRSRLSMSPNLCRQRETVDYLRSKLARWKPNSRSSCDRRSNEVLLGLRPVMAEGHREAFLMTVREFQKAETGIVDGRVDVNGPAIKKLEYLHPARIYSDAIPLGPF